MQQDTPTTRPPPPRTLSFAKGLRNVTKEAGDFLRLRCEVAAGGARAKQLQWTKNGAPLLEEKNRVRTKVSSTWSLGWQLQLFYFFHYTAMAMEWNVSQPLIKKSRARTATKSVRYFK